jgi:large subunit ribosomal protein L10
VPKEILEQKKQIVEDIKKKISSASSLVIVDYKGLTVKQDTELRAEFRKSGVEYRVLKNRLVKIAFNQLGTKDFDSSLEGTNAFAFGGRDLVAPAKIVLDSQKKYANKLAVKCGMVDGKFIDEQGVKELANLPPKEQIIAKLLGCMQAPIANLAYVLKATMSGLAVCLNKIAEQKQA